MKTVGGKIKPGKDEIEHIRLLEFKSIPERLAFEHSSMIKDHIPIKEMAKLAEEIKKCRKCRLHETRINAVPGERPFDAKIMICGQAPGKPSAKPH